MIEIVIMKLNIYLFFQLSVENDTFEPLGSWCCVSGTVTAKLRLEKKGYTVKESVPVCAEIKNLSSRRISSTSVSLIQVINIDFNDNQCLIMFFSYRLKILIFRMKKKKLSIFLS